MNGSTTLLAAALLIGPITAARGQDSIPTAETAAAAWLDLVAAGGADAAWRQADGYFRERLPDWAWRKWVAAQHDRLGELRNRRVLELTGGRDESAAPPLEWAVYFFGSDRPAGGRIIQRVNVARVAGVWVVYDYAAWPDPAAVVNNAYLDPIPYDAIVLGRGLRHRGRPRPPLGSPAGASPPRAVANPRTFPHRPPLRR